MARKRKGFQIPFKYLVTAVIAMFVVFMVVQKWFLPDRMPVAASLYPVFGIDVSRHSGKIDWAKIKKANVSFAYIKATEGEDYIDPLFNENYVNAKKGKMLTGAYHFFRFSKDGEKQALLFIKTARMTKGDLIPVLDVEIWGNTFSTRSDKEVIGEIGSFLRMVRLKMGVKPMIYTNQDAYERYIAKNFADYPLWICDLSNEPTDVVKKWDFWQYSHKGKLEGAPYKIDFNVYRRSLSDLKSRFLIR